MSRAFADALLNPELPPPAGLCTWNQSDPARRFAVYRNNVTASLIDALADTFNVTQELVGAEFFRAMARLFVRQSPPRSRVLAFYGADFPAFIESFAPASALPYLADVARLEMLRVCAYHAADAAALPAAGFAPLLEDADALPDLLLEFQPSAAVLVSKYAVVSLWAAHQGLVDIGAVDPCRPESALIVRPDLDVEVVALNAGAGDFIARLRRGESLGGAFAAVSRDGAEVDLSGTLGLLIRSGAITAVSTGR